MQRAMNQDDIDVFAWKAEKNDGNNYKCPHCKSAVTLKKGDKKIAHFAHKSLNQCPFNSEPESEEHVNMKINFLNYLRRNRPELVVEIEKILIPKRKADMVIYENNQTFIVEFQASKIGRKELKERTRDYNIAGYPVLWIFHIQRLKLENFTKYTKYQRVPDELEYLYDGDSLFIMNNTGYIQKCFLKKKAGTKSTFKPSFFNTNRTFKFNTVIMNQKNKESLYLCQIGKNSRKSKQFYYYGYLLDSNKYLTTNSKSIIRQSIQEELMKITSVPNISVYSPYQIQNDIITFNCFICSEDIAIKKSYRFGKGIYILLPKPLAKDKILQLLKKVKLLNTPKAAPISDKKTEENSLQQVAATTIETKNKQEKFTLQENTSSQKINFKNKKSYSESSDEKIPWYKKTIYAVTSLFKRKK